MIELVINLVPRGNRAKTTTLGKLTIANEFCTNERVGEYAYSYYYEDTEGWIGHPLFGTVTHIRRQNFFKLLSHVLKNITETYPLGDMKI